MVTANFWTFLNHLLSEETEQPPFDATRILQHLSPLLHELAEKTPSEFERRAFRILATHIEDYQGAPTRMAFYAAVQAISSPDDTQDLQTFAAQCQFGLPRYGVSDTLMLLTQYEEGRDAYLTEMATVTFREIIAKPTKVRTKTLHGFKDAQEYLLQAVSRLGSSAKSINTLNLAEDGEEAYAAYLSEAEEAQTCAKMHVGLPIIDNHFKGFRRGELITVMGYTGDGKTTLCINWAYQAFLEGFNVVYISLEMPAEDIKKRFHIRHAANKHIFSHKDVKLSQYMDMEMTEDEANFMFREVIPDFTANVEPDLNTQRGSIRVIETTEGSFTLDLLKAELLRHNAECPVDVLVLDYPNLMEVQIERGQDFDKAMSRMYVKLKTLCRTFNDGQRLIGLIPTQVNRAGRDAAEKAHGIYTLRAIHEYSEIANSADFVFAVFRDSALTSQNECIITNLKARRNGELPCSEHAFHTTFIGAVCMVSEKTAENPAASGATAATTAPTLLNPPPAFNLGIS